MATKGKTTAPAKPAKEAKAPKVAEQAPVTHVKFNGYDDSVPDNERVLVEGEVYQVVGFDEKEGIYTVHMANAEFDSSKKVNAKTNPEFVEVECFSEEVEAVDAPEDAAEKPPVTADKSQKVKGGKAPAAPKQAKEKAPKAPKVEAEQEEDDSMPVLTDEQEDAEVLAMVSEAEGAEGLISIAQELEGVIATSEYRIGGILYHIKKDGSYKQLDNGAYAGNKGFQEFLKAYTNVDYRKAQYLIKIYVTFGQAGIENPAEVVARIGWTKASVLVDPMTKEGANAEDLIKLAETNTVADLRSTIEEQTVNVGGTRTPGESKTRVTMKFRFYEEKAVQLTEILTAVKAEQGFLDDGEALDFILTDWAANNTGKEVEADKAPAQTAPAAKKTTAKAAAKPAASKPRAAAAA